MTKQCDQYFVEILIENEWKKFGGFNTFGKDNIMMPDDFPHTSEDEQLSPLILTLTQAEWVETVLTRPIQFNGLGYPLNAVKIRKFPDFLF